MNRQVCSYMTFRNVLVLTFFCFTVPLWGMHEGLEELRSRYKKAEVEYKMAVIGDRVDALPQYTLLADMCGEQATSTLYDVKQELFKVKYKAERNDVMSHKMSDLAKEYLQKIEKKEKRYEKLMNLSTDWTTFYFCGFEVEKKSNGKWGPTEESLHKIIEFRIKLTRAGMPEQKFIDDIKKVVEQSKLTQEARERRQHGDCRQVSREEREKIINKKLVAREKDALSRLEGLKNKAVLTGQDKALVNDCLHVLGVVKNTDAHNKYSEIFEDRL